MKPWFTRVPCLLATNPIVEAAKLKTVIEFKLIEPRIRGIVIADKILD